MRTVTKTCAGAELALLHWVSQIYLIKDVILALVSVGGDTVNIVDFYQIIARGIGQVFPVV